MCVGKPVSLCENTLKPFWWTDLGDTLFCGAGWDRASIFSLMLGRIVKKLNLKEKKRADKQLKLDLILAKRGDQTFEMGIAFIIFPGVWTAL